MVLLASTGATTIPGYDLRTLDARLAIGKKYATKYALDAALICAVAEHESSWNPWAVRFEPAFEVRYVKPHIPEMPTTLEMTKAMSFGLMQIMGEVAIELGWAGRFLTELCDPDTGVDFGCRKLRKCVDAHPGDTSAALLAYNGGGDPTYPAKVLPLMPHYLG